MATLITTSHMFGAKQIALCVDEEGVAIPVMLTSPGKVAFEAYYKTSYGASLLEGVALPNFNQLKREIQEAWEDAAEAVLNLREVNHEQRPSETESKKKA